VAAGEPLPAAVRNACRHSGRRKLDDLAECIATSATWDDLVLPEAQVSALRQIAAQVRRCARVYEDWGFGRRNGRGLGVAALFCGGSGTGKTLAAEVLASELGLDLYRIDLSSVVSKYIGETEKNLRRVFDALFGKRSDVKDSHDRYANIEVSYLLQRMEAHRGLAVLTTNLKSALDPSFQRRLRFIVHFPFPDARQREAIWRRSFPAVAPTSGLDFSKLARLNVAGGSVRNIALNAAFLAADGGEPIAMHHLLAAAQAEGAKIERQLSDAETRGWT
jgi:SpoVK/Ycf46/Vps4 family AAA+-type ATPase